MASTFFGLNIGTSGLYTYQAALNTTAHNVSNVETLGYTRQVLNQTAGNPISVGSSYGMVGTGVTATTITQVRNNYYDTKYRSNSAIYGNYYVKEQYMKEMETYFNEIDSQGFMTNFSNFSSSLQELSKNPSSTSVRSQIINYGKSLSEQVNYLANSLATMQKEANTDIKNTADRINSLNEQIAMLTKQINTVEANGTIANDLRDQRNVLVDELSEYANVSVSEHVVGDDVGRTSYLVKIDGKIAVNTTEYVTLNAVPRTTKNNVGDIEGVYDLVWSDGQELNEASKTLGGSLQALFELRDGNNGEQFRGTVSAQDGNKITLSNANVESELLLNIPPSGKLKIGNIEMEYTSFSMKKGADGTLEYTFELEEGSKNYNFQDGVASIGANVNYKGIPYYMNELNEFVRTFSKAYNDIHKTGNDMNGTPGLDFFTGYNKVDGGDYTFGAAGEAFTYENSYYHMNALNFSVNQQIQKDPNTIVTSSNPDNGVESADILDKLIKVIDDKSMFKEGSPVSFFQTLISDVGIDTKKAEDFAVSQKNIVSSVDNQRISVSGVDVDEEAMNLVRFQNAYNLSAKVISIMDEVYEQLINYMGA